MADRSAWRAFLCSSTPEPEVHFGARTSLFHLLGATSGMLLPVDTTWWAYVVPLVSAALGGLVGLGLERYRSRRRRVSYALSVERLVSEAVPLTVFYQDHPVDAPHLVTARLTNEGPQDLTIDDFKGGVLGIRIAGANVVAPIQHTLDGDPLELDAEATADGLVSIKPTLIPQGSTIELSVLVSGAIPSAKETIRLRQTSAVDANGVRMEPQAAKAVFRQGVALAVVAGAFSLSLLVNLTTGSTSTTGGPVTTAIMAASLAAMAGFIAIRILPAMSDQVKGISSPSG